MLHIPERLRLGSVERRTMPVTRASISTITQPRLLDAGSRHARKSRKSQSMRRKSCGISMSRSSSGSALMKESRTSDSVSARIRPVYEAPPLRGHCASRFALPDQESEPEGDEEHQHAVDGGRKAQLGRPQHALCDHD